ncbi:hypothetical protein [Streptomyces sp. NPDC002540]
MIVGHLNSPCSAVGCQRGSAGEGDEPVGPAGCPAQGTALAELLTARQEPGTLLDANAVRDQITQSWRTLPL